MLVYAVFSSRSSLELHHLEIDSSLKINCVFTFVILSGLRMSVPHAVHVSVTMTLHRVFVLMIILTELFKVMDSY